VAAIDFWSGKGWRWREILGMSAMWASLMLLLYECGSQLLRKVSLLEMLINVSCSQVNRSFQSYNVLNSYDLYPMLIVRGKSPVKFVSNWEERGNSIMSTCLLTKTTRILLIIVWKRLNLWIMLLTWYKFFSWQRIKFLANCTKKNLPKNREHFSPIYKVN